LRTLREEENTMSLYSTPMAEQCPHHKVKFQYSVQRSKYLETMGINNTVLLYLQTGHKSCKQRSTVVTNPWCVN
jgi:hypothetical protein